ncbi:MAG: zinc ribbon domain-containing protein [Chloroflexota bacterium]
MPIYEYTCPDCGLEFEKLRPFRQADEKTPCPHCQKPAAKRLSTFACFSRGEGGATSPIAGSGGSCGSCGSSSCGTCGH